MEDLVTANSEVLVLAAAEKVVVVTICVVMEAVPMVIQAMDRDMDVVVEQFQ